MIRNLLFWAHFGAGLVIGVFALIMAATGVLMTYERQIIHSFETAAIDPPNSDAVPLTLDQLAMKAKDFAPTDDGLILEVHDSSSAPVKLMKGRKTLGYLDPYTGVGVDTGVESVKAAFSTLQDVHRHLALAGSARPFGQTVMSAVNLIFLVMLISGAVLWLPKIWTVASLKRRVFLTARPTNKRARNFNWHHAFGAWAIIPLIVIALTGLVFSYDWAEKAVYAVAGDAPARVALQAPPETVDAETTDLQSLSEKAVTQIENWRKFRLVLPGANQDGPVEFTVYYGREDIPTQRTKLSYDKGTGALVSEEPFQSIAPGRRARIFIRYLHTGEVYGIFGQTIAGFASLLACLLIYSGLSLALGRVRGWVKKTT